MDHTNGTFDGEILRARRYALNPDHDNNGQHLEWIELVEIRWPSGESDLMEHCHRKAGTWAYATPAGAHPDFWVRFAYRDWESASSYLESMERGYGTLLSVVSVDSDAVDASRLGCGAYWGHGKPGDYWDSTEQTIYRSNA